MGLRNFGDKASNAIRQALRYFVSFNCSWHIVTKAPQKSD